MTQPESDDSWEWVIPPNGGEIEYEGKDLSGAIELGYRINELRENAGLSVQDVEDYSGVLKSNLLMLEAGLLELDAGTAEQLAMVFGVSVAELTG
ncbi:MAG: helix-turn-helix domain-containing protein [Granulosicoccus sp.]